MILGGDVFRMGEWLRGRRKWLRGRRKWLRGRGGWLRGRRRGMPALSRLFRFQNIRIPRHPAFSVLVPDAAAVYSPAAKKLPWGLRPSVRAAEYQGLPAFFHSHTKSGCPISSRCHLQAFHFYFQFRIIQALSPTLPD